MFPRLKLDKIYFEITCGNTSSFNNLLKISDDKHLLVANDVLENNYGYTRKIKDIRF